MANLADVFTESERTNWLKAWLAIDIAKSGIEQFAENEAKILQGNIYNSILTNGAVGCCGCHTANLLKCPSPGICNKRGANSLCESMHDTALKQPRPCSSNICDKVLVEIVKQHKFSNPSWKNTLANHWASSPWQIAKAYLPPDGYTGKSTVQETDFNGIISFMMNCKHFDNLFSFPIAPGKTYTPCPLTKARELGRTVRHSSTCKVTDTDLQDIFITLTTLLTDQTCLVNDVAAQEAVRKLAKLQTDVLKLTTEEIIDLLEAAQDKLKKVENITETIDEMRIYIENCKQNLIVHAEKCKQELDQHTGKCKEELDEHRRKSTETDYDHSCTDFRRRLMAHYDDTCSNVPLSILDQSLDKRIVDIFATPKIHRIKIGKDGKHVTNEQVLTYKEIFCTENTSNRRIYLQGEPGSGKSTFSAKLVHDWSHGIQVSSATPSKTTAFDDVSTIQKYKFLFFITLRDSRGQTDVTEMIKKQLIDTQFSVDERANVYKLFVQIMNTENCLVIREGLDEWVSLNGSNLAEPSMAGFQKDTCTVLTTSRPWKLADESIKNSQIDSLLEIEGISNPYKFSKNILRCIIDQTKDINETAVKFQFFVQDRKLESLYSSPMLYTLVIYTWVNTNRKDECLKRSSHCTLYTTLLECLCKKANSTTGYFNDSNPPPVPCFSNTRYLQPNIKHLDKLAKAACKLLFSSERESSIVFSDITLSSFFSPDEFTVSRMFALKAGILTNRKDKSQTGCSNSFVHKSVQELLAAYHIACYPSVIDDVICRYLQRNNKSYLEISQVLIFLCGMNTFAANKLSALLNQFDAYLCYEYQLEMWGDPTDLSEELYSDECDRSHLPCRFQRIIESGIREAAANNQESIQLELNHCYIDERNIRDLNNKITVKDLYVHTDKSDFPDSPAYDEPTSHFELFVDTDNSEVPCSPARGESTSHFEFNLSSCHNLRKMYLTGKSICLKDTASSVSSEFPVWIILDRLNPAKVSATLQVLTSIESIHLDKVTCSSTCLRSMFSTLLTLDHKVECVLRCYITSCEQGSDICTKTVTTIKTHVDSELRVDYLFHDSPGLWEALHGLNIKSLRMCLKYTHFSFDFKEMFLQFLSSLIHLETLDVGIHYELPSLLKAIHGLNIKSLSLSQGEIGVFRDFTVNYIESLSQSLSSLTRLETISIDVSKDSWFTSESENSPGVCKALFGLNIKSLGLKNLSVRTGGSIMTHVKSLSQSLSSLTQLETLSICVYEDNPDLLEALRGLNIKRLSLICCWSHCLNVNHVESMSQSLSSLAQLETLNIKLYEDSPGLWEALRGLTIKSLSLYMEYSGLRVKHIESLSQSLASLTQLGTLRISVRREIPGLLEALRGLNIKSLSLRLTDVYEGLSENHAAASSQYLLSLKHLETLSIGVDYYFRSHWTDQFHGLNVYSMSLDINWVRLHNNESLSQCLSSFELLETVSIVMYWNKGRSSLWKDLHGLNIKNLKLEIISKVDSSHSLSSLTQLETLSVSVDEDSPSLWESLCGLNIKRLSLSGKWSRCLRVNHVESLAQCLSSLTQLESLTIGVSEKKPCLWRALRDLNINTMFL